MTHFNWIPGIGDPTIGAWVTVALYLLASGSCWISAQKLRLEDIPRSNERRAWRAISVLLLALGINKQLDLQTALTAAGRVLAKNQGWYEQRQFVQLVFIALAVMICLIAAITLLLWARNSPISHRGRSDRHRDGSRLCINPRGILPPRRPVYWPKNSGSALELDFRNERNQLGLFCKSMAPSWCKIDVEIGPCQSKKIDVKGADAQCPQ